MYCFDQETTDYARPIVFVVQVGLQDPEHGPVLDDSWPTVTRTEVRGHASNIRERISTWIFSPMHLDLASCPFGTAVMRTNAACPTWLCRARPTWWLESRFTLLAQARVCLLRQLSFRWCLTPLPLFKSHPSLPSRQFCAQPLHAHGVFCRHPSEGRNEASWRVIEGDRRRMVVDARLENKGENAYSARLNVTYTPNLRFSSLIVKVGCLPSFQINKFKNNAPAVPKYNCYSYTGHLWYQNRLLHWEQAEEWEDLQRQRSIHEGQKSGEIFKALIFVDFQILEDSS